MTRSKRIIIIVLAIIIGIGCAFGIDYRLYSGESHKETKMEGYSILEQGTDYQQLTANCQLTYDSTVNGYKYTVTDADPQMYLDPGRSPFSVIQIRFLKPVEYNFRLQVYFPDADDVLSEANSVIREVPATSEEIEVEIPENTYGYIRLDLDGNATISQIRSGAIQEYDLPYTPDWKSVILISVTIAVLLSLLLFWIVKKKTLAKDKILTLSYIRNTANNGARILYHLFAIIYIFGSFLYILYWNADLWTPMSELGNRICEIIRYGMVILIIEQLTRKPIHALFTIGLTAVGWIAFQNSEVNRLVDFLLFYMLSDLADEKTMPKLFLVEFVIMLSGLGVLIHLGYVNSLIVRFTYAPGYALGFGHPNTTGAVVLTLAVLIYLVFLKKHSWLFAVFSWMMAAFAWLVPASRTVTILLILMPIALFLVRWIGQSKAKKILYLAPLVPWLFFAISYGIALYLMKTNGANVFSTADGNMMARFSYTVQAIQKYGYTLFGTKIPDEIILDNCYLNILMRYGVVSLIIVLSLFSYTLYRFVKKDRYEYVALLLLYMVYGIMERCPVHLFNHFIPFVAFSVMADSSEQKTLKQMTVRGRALLSCAVVMVCVLTCTIVRTPGHIGLRGAGRNYGNSAVTGFIDGSARQTQTFTVTNQMEGVQFLAATYGTKPEGQYALTLYDVNGKELETQAVDGKEIYDSVFIRVFFGRTYPAGKYQMYFYPVSVAGDSLAIWQNDHDPYPAGEALVNGNPTGADWVFDIFETAYSWKWLYRALIGLLGGYLIFCIWILNRRQESLILTDTKSIIS